MLLVEKLSAIFFFFSSIFLIEGLSTQCSDTGLKSTIKGNMTCSFYMDVYVDGRKTGYNENHNNLDHQTIKAGSHAIAVRCRCRYPPCGGTILASFDNGLVTDTSWKCTTKFETGWYFENFDDLHWSTALSHGVNRESPMPWGKIRHFSDEAHFIWTTNYTHDHVVYCRRRLVEKCTKVTEAYFHGKEKYTNFALDGHVLDNITVDSQLDCALRCSRTTGCVSFNLDNTRLSRRACELSRATAVTNPSDLIRRNGFDYYEAVKVYY